MFTLSREHAFEQAWRPYISYSFFVILLFTTNVWELNSTSCIERTSSESRRPHWSSIRTEINSSRPEFWNLLFQKPACIPHSISCQVNCYFLHPLLHKLCINTRRCLFSILLPVTLCKRSKTRWMRMLSANDSLPFVAPVQGCCTRLDTDIKSSL